MPSWTNTQQLWRDVRFPLRCGCACVIKNARQECVPSCNSFAFEMWEITSAFAKNRFEYAAWTLIWMIKNHDHANLIVNETRSNGSTAKRYKNITFFRLHLSEIKLFWLDYEVGGQIWDAKIIRHGKEQISKWIGLLGHFEAWNMSLFLEPLKI